MRNTLFVACIIVLLGLTVPAVAQLRQDAAAQESSVRLYDYGQSAFSLNKIFSPDHFRMSHSFEFSSGSFGGGASSLAMYTNSMMWQFNQKLAARLDLAFAYSPFSNDRLQGGTNGQNGQVFIRNAEIAFRPSDRTQIHLSFRQSPYGYYASPYGYSGYGLGRYGRNSIQATVGSLDRDLFWKNGAR